MSLFLKFIAWWNAESAVERKHVNAHRAVPSDRFDKFGNYVFKDAKIAKLAGVAKSLRATMSAPVFTQTTLPVNQNWTDVVWGGNKFVAVGWSATGAYSSDGITWTSMTMPANQNWKAVTYGGGVFVAVGGGLSGAFSNVAAYSSDGITWTSSTLSSSDDWVDVAYGNGTFVAVGNGAAVGDSCYSSTGASWTASTTVGGLTFGNISWVNNMFIATAGGYQNNYSSDGITWSEGAFPSNAAAYYAPSYGNALYVIGNPGEPGAAYSSNGTTWTNVALATGPANIAFNNGEFVATSGGGTTGLYTTDGMSWTIVSGMFPTVTGGVNWIAICSNTSRFVTVGGSSSAAAYWIPSSAPSAPTLQSPANASYQDVSSGETFSAIYNSTDGANQNAYAMRIKVSGGSYNYYNAGTNALQSTIVWNADNIAPGGTFSTTLPSTAISDGNVYNWSFASQESISNLQGVFASDFTFTASAPPTVNVTAPNGNIASNSPVVTWADTLGGTTQADYQVIVEYGAFSTTPGSGVSAWNSGLVASPATSVTIGATLTNTVTYRAFVQITNSGGQLSSWAYTTFTVTVDAPATPILTAVAANDPTTGAPMVQLTLQANDNELTTVQASCEGGLTTGYGGDGNTTIAASNVWSQDGSYSLQMTAIAAGNVSAGTPSGTSGFVCSPGETVRCMAFFHSSSTPRVGKVNVVFWNAAGVQISTVASPDAYSTLTGAGGQAFVSTVAPAGTATMSFYAQGINLAASENIYADCMFLGPGSSRTWTAGGFVGITTATINFSDDQVNYYPVRNGVNVSIPPLTQKVVVNDYEGALGFTRYYQGQVSA